MKLRVSCENSNSISKNNNSDLSLIQTITDTFTITSNMTDLEFDKTINVLYAPGEKLNNYVVNKIIGDGSYSIVYDIYDSSINVHYAAKCLNYTFNDNITNLDEAIEYTKINKMQLYKEIMFNKLINISDQMNFIPLMKYKNIIYDNNKKKLIFIFPLLKHNLYEAKLIIREQNALAKIIFKIAFGLYFMHNWLQYIHTDIKLDNIMKINENLDIEISDFGLVQKLDNNVCKQRNVCPDAIRPPELLFDQEIHDTIDIWCFANLIIHLLIINNNHDTEFKVTKNCILCCDTKLTFIKSYINLKGYITKEDYVYNYLNKELDRFSLEKINVEIHNNYNKIQKVNKCINVLKKCLSKVKENPTTYDTDYIKKNIIGFDNTFYKLINSMLEIDPKKRCKAYDILHSDFIKKFYPRSINIIKMVESLPTYKSYDINPMCRE